MEISSNQEDFSSGRLLIKKQFFQNKSGWSLSSQIGLSVDENQQALPWFTYPAIDFLKKNLQTDYEIFEFGCGASTIFFGQFTKKTFSLETNKIWFEFICEKLAKRGVHQKSSKHFLSDKHEIFLIEDGLTNQNYESFLQNLNKKFDLILIDSIKRKKCSQKAIEFIKADGVIVLDDSQRRHYKKIFNLFKEKGFLKTDFWGISPGQITLKNTSFFRKNYAAQLNAF